MFGLFTNLAIENKLVEEHKMRVASIEAQKRLESENRGSRFVTFNGETKLLPLALAEIVEREEKEKKDEKLQELKKNIFNIDDFNWVFIFKLNSMGLKSDDDLIPAIELCLEEAGYKIAIDAVGNKVINFLKFMARIFKPKSNLLFLQGMGCIEFHQIDFLFEDTEDPVKLLLPYCIVNYDCFKGYSDVVGNIVYNNKEELIATDTPTTYKENYGATRSEYIDFKDFIEKYFVQLEDFNKSLKKVKKP